MSTPRTVLSLAMVASLALVACTAAATPSPAPTVAPSVAPSKTTDGTLPKPELSTIKLGTPIGEVSQFGPVYADVAGIYEKYGIKVTVTKFNAGGDAVQAVLSGAVDLGATLDSTYTLASQLTDTPAEAVSVYKSRVFDGLFCTKDIKTAADVKGKTMAVSTLGATAHASVLLALDALKLTDKDVQIVQVGGQSVRIAAMKAGSVGCAPVSIDLKPDMDALGFNLLTDLSKTDLAYPAVGLGGLTSFITKNPNTVLVMLAAQLEAAWAMIKDPAKVAPEWAKFAQIDNAKALTQVTAAGPQLNPTMVCTDAGFAFTQKVFSIVSPSVTMADPKKACDESFTQKLMDIGFYKKLGIPTT